MSTGSENTVLVTGGAGYIGSHTVLALLDAGFQVVVLDNLSTGRRAAVPSAVPLVEGNIADADLVGRLVTEHGIGSVIHFAGSVVVPESIADPLRYYENNTAASRTLIEACVRNGIDRFIFSSTAAVYGMPEVSPVTETTPTEPINPYGASKLMTERMLQDTAAAHDFRNVALRYFNVAGADPEGRTGLSSPNATHLLKIACQAATGSRDRIEIFGDDYDTPDGTCIRDFIHVTDLADAHVATLRHLIEGADSNIFNCGYGRGYSVKTVIDEVKRNSGVDFEVGISPRRPGDPPSIVADTTKISRTLAWQPRYDDLALIIRHALAWEEILKKM